MGTNTNTDSLISALCAEYNFLPDHCAEKGIAQTVLCNIVKIPQMTLEEISGLCSVSESTFVRFCRRMGYASFTDFKTRIGSALENYPYRPSHFKGSAVVISQTFCRDIKQAVQNDLESFWECFDFSSCTALVDAMHQSRHIYFHDTVYSTIRLFLQSDLAFDQKMVTFSPNAAQQLQDVQTAQEGALFIFMHDGHIRSKEMLHCMQELQNRHTLIKSAVFSVFPKFPAATDCDYFFQIPQGSSSLTDLMIHDLIYEYLSILYREKFLYPRQ